MRSRSARCGLAILAAATLAGCSLVTSLDGLTGGSEGAPIDDAGASPIARDASSSSTPPPSGSGSGPAIDAATSDAGSIDDGATPIDDGAPPIADAADATPPPPLFSDDFESGPLPGKWDALDTHRATAGLDPSTYVSPKESFGAFTQAIVSGQTTRARLQKAFAAPAPGVTLVLETSLDVRLYDLANRADAVLAELELVDAAGGVYELQLDVGVDAAGALRMHLNENTSLADGGAAFVVHDAPDPLKAGVWSRVRIELHPSAPATARLSVDGVVEVDTAATVTVASPAKTQIQLGVSAASAPSDPWTIDYDDALYDVRR